MLFQNYKGSELFSISNLFDFQQRKQRQSFMLRNLPINYLFIYFLPFYADIHIRMYSTSSWRSGISYYMGLNLITHRNLLEKFYKTQIFFLPHLKLIKSESPTVGRWKQESVPLTISSNGSDTQPDLRNVCQTSFSFILSQIILIFLFTTSFSL